MFHGAESFNQPVNKWDVSNVDNMFFLFSNSHSFNQSLNDWDVSNVTDMDAMFAFASSFNQPLNDWNVLTSGALSNVGGSFAARWARMVLKRCSSERGEREKRFYGGGKGERRRTAF